MRYQYLSIKIGIAEALAVEDDSLRSRILFILGDLPVGTRLHDDQGIVCQVERTQHGHRIILDSNGDVLVADDGEDSLTDRCTVSAEATRALARRIPEALIRYMRKCEAGIAPAVHS